MCFSPEGDLVGGLVVTGIGADACRHLRGRNDKLMLAALPLLLGTHQLIEAFVWWGQEGHVPAEVGRIAREHEDVLRRLANGNPRVRFVGRLAVELQCGHGSHVAGTATGFLSSTFCTLPARACQVGCELALSCRRGRDLLGGDSD